jgi:nicotinamide-nucleotide amidase
MRVEIITIGTELLLGEIVDTNTATLARAMRPLGLDLLRSSTVGDNAGRISAAIQESLARAPILITSGGLGPTVDDATREGIAAALALPLEFRPELWSQIQARFARFGAKPTENNRRQALIPRGGTALENPVGTAPAFIVEGKQNTVIALPGVPAELEALLQAAVLPYLRHRFDLHAIIRTRILRSAGVGESWLDSQIADLERLDNPTVGLAAHPGQVDIRITAKADAEPQAQEMIGQVEAELLSRLGKTIYGFDDDTLEAVVLAQIRRKGWRLGLVEIGTGGALAHQLAAIGDPFAGALLLPVPASEERLQVELNRSQVDFASQIALGLHLTQEGEQQRLIILLQMPGAAERLERTYGGPPGYGPSWAATMALNLIRGNL